MESLFHTTKDTDVLLTRCQGDFEKKNSIIATIKDF